MEKEALLTEYILTNENYEREERWMTRCREIVSFIETNHRNPSKYVGSERELVNWTKQQRKLINAGKLKEP